MRKFWNIYLRWCQHGQVYILPWEFPMMLRILCFRPEISLIKFIVRYAVFRSSVNDFNSTVELQCPEHHWKHEICSRQGSSSE